MADNLSLSATVRESVGKGAAREAEGMTLSLALFMGALRSL